MIKYYTKDYVDFIGNVATNKLIKIVWTPTTAVAWPSMTCMTFIAIFFAIDKQLKSGDTCCLNMNNCSTNRE